MELKDYEDTSLLVPQAQKFGERCTLYGQKFPGCQVHRLMIIDDDTSTLPPNLAEECLNQKIRLQRFSRIRMLDDQVEALGPEFALLEYLKNSFKISIRYAGAPAIQVRAVKQGFGKTENYTFSIPAKTLLALAYVFRATSDSDPDLEDAY